MDTRTPEDKARDRGVHGRKDYGSNVPQARKDLQKLMRHMLKFSDRLDSVPQSVLRSFVIEIRRIEQGDMRQRSPVQRSASVHKMTPEIKMCVMSYKNTGTPALEVAIQCGTDGGRVSEIWNGLS